MSVSNISLGIFPSLFRDAILLQTFPQEIAQLGPDVSLVAHPTYFDSLLMEILQIPYTKSNIGTLTY